MNWLIRVAFRNFNPDERIIAAAIRIGKMIFTGYAHFLAASKAIQAGWLFRTPDKERFYTKNGMPMEEGFITNQHQFLTRDEALEYFGILTSESIGEQQPVFASRISTAMINDELRYIEQLRGAKHIPQSPQQRMMLDNFLPSIERAFRTKGFISPAQQKTWSNIKARFGLPATSEFCAECGKHSPNRRGDFCDECKRYRQYGS